MEYNLYDVSMKMYNSRTLKIKATNLNKSESKIKVIDSRCKFWVKKGKRERGNGSGKKVFPSQSKAFSQ